ncbi:MAG: EAL domain-containing protein, partial [Lachnospiraceae bacterium]|nr:EAL domain-containing protein [Lachnospiraceae bacterium]
MDIWNLNYLIYWGKMKLLPEQKEQQYAVAYLNVSQFRHYNIIYGWNAGQKLLESVADVLSHNVDERKEICARNQGDRFVLLLTFESQEALLERAKQLVQVIEKRIYDNTENRMAIHMGVYFLPPESNDLRVAANYANQAIDSLRDSHISEVKVYDASLEKAIKDRHEQERLLDSVDVNKDFVTYYQAKVDIRTEKIIGAEALIRFLDPWDSGRVKSPAFFVPYYEQTGRVTELDFFVLECVCKMLRRRLDEGKEVVTISCNFSRKHFMKPGFPERFEAVLEKYQISKEYIEVEVTETVVVEELQLSTVKQTLEILKEKNIRISIDDFGSGYSSLGVFEQIPASVIKLDRSFLLNQKDRNRQVMIMRGIVNLGKELNAQIVCEGVETDDDVELMREIGAYVAQGYRYSKPIPEDEFEKKLDTN